MLSNLTICIPIRIDSPGRHSNLNTVIDYISQSTNFCCPILVIEADTTPKIDASEFSHNVSYSFIEDFNSTFHRTHYINMMLRQVNTQFAAIWDSDIIIHPRQIKASLSLVNHNTPLVLPYNGICYNVPEYISEKFKESKNIEIFYRYTDLMSLMNPYRVVGGAFIVDVAEYKKAG